MKKNSKQQIDTNNQNKTNREVAEWKKRFELIAEASGQIVYDYCLCDGSIEWSGSIEKVLGYKPSEMNGGIKQWEKLIHKDDRSEALRLLEFAEKNLVPYEVEYRYKHKDGHYVDFLDRGFFIFSPEKDCMRMIGMMQDISEQTKVEKALQESEDLFRKIFEESPMGMVMSDEYSNFTKVNEVSCKMLGYTEDELKSKKYYDITHPDYPELKSEVEAVRKIKDGELPHYKVEKPYLTKNKETVWGSLTLSSIRNKKGDFQYFLAMIEDITERKKAERENVLLAQMVKSVKDCISITDINNNIIYVNDSFLQTYGYTEKEVIGKNISFLRPERLNGLSELIHRETIEGGWYSELVNVKKDGTEFPIELWTSTVKDDNNNIMATVGIARDITDRKQAKEEIEDANKKLVRAQRVARIGSWEILFPSNERHWSENMYEIMGFPKNIKVNMAELEKRVTTSEFDRFKKALDETINTGKQYSMDYRILMPDGTAKYIHDEGEVIKNNEGEIISMFGTTQDITENKLSEIALKESEEKMQSLFRVAPAGIGLVKDRILMDVNLRVCEMTGYTKEELIGKSSRVLYPTQEDFEFVGIEKYRQIKEGGTGLVETRWLKKSGTIINIILSSTPVDRNDTSKGVIFTALDITERKEAEGKLRRSEERFKQVAESADEWIWEVNTEGLYTYASPVIEKILGYNFEEVVNKKHFYDFFLPDERDEIKKVAFKVFSKKEKIKGLINKNVHKDGKTVILETSGVPVLDDKNNLLGYRGVDTDITARQQAEEELVKAKERAEEMNRVKTSFLANMSHEVRTPLVAILGFSEVLSEIVKEDELKNYVDMIHKGGERLLDTLNLILDLSVIEAQKIKIELSPLNIVKEINDVVALFKKNAERKNLQIETVCELDSIVIDLDIKILRQIMNNLINNAIKYTTAGIIKVRINEEEKDDKNYIAIRVEDTGIGIPNDKHELIWEEFRQASEGFNRSFEGAGLGLSITKKFVAKLGGEIFLEKSEIDVGSVFTVLFPCEGKIEALSTQKTSDTGIGKIVIPAEIVIPEVLYVEDDPIAIDIVKAFIKGYCTIDSSFSGKEGIEKARNKLYDAILMDINLGSDMDGLEAIKIIREIPEYKYIPIIAVTAFAMVGDKDDFFEKGCTHYISKPFTKVELQQLIAEVLQKIK